MRQNLSGGFSSIKTPKPILVLTYHVMPVLPEPVDASNLYAQKLKKI